MTRSLCCWPPPQFLEHDAQSSHSPHWQFSTSHAGRWQLAASMRLSLHPAPLPARVCVTLRHRVCSPAPQETEQGDHSAQEETWHGWLGPQEVYSLQGRAWVISMTGGHAAPPNSGYWCTCRCRVCCPPVQVLLQLPHSTQSESWQSNFWKRSQPAISSMSPDEHGVPPFSASCTTTFDRVRWPVWSQRAQSSHTLRAQSFGTTPVHAWTVHP
mmetsp:Transcript_54448/g.95553  ORF Transcript_54448/g.95553 Transcript_54448/m.95553 type:complete len:213 (+) Transcript_54448:1471-2109(+)